MDSGAKTSTVGHGSSLSARRSPVRSGSHVRFENGSFDLDHLAHHVKRRSGLVILHDVGGHDLGVETVALAEVGHGRGRDRRIGHGKRNVSVARVADPLPDARIGIVRPGDALFERRVISPLASRAARELLAGAVLFGNVLLEIASRRVPAVAYEARERRVIATVNELVLAQVAQGTEALLADDATVHFYARVDDGVLLQDAGRRERLAAEVAGERSRLEVPHLVLLQVSGGRVTLSADRTRVGLAVRRVLQPVLFEIPGGGEPLAAIFALERPRAVVSQGVLLQIPVSRVELVALRALECLLFARPSEVAPERGTGAVEAVEVQPVHLGVPLELADQKKPFAAIRARIEPKAAAGALIVVLLERLEVREVGLARRTSEVLNRRMVVVRRRTDVVVIVVALGRLLWLRRWLLLLLLLLGLGYRGRREGRQEPHLALERVNDRMLVELFRILELESADVALEQPRLEVDRHVFFEHAFESEELVAEETLVKGHKIQVCH